MNTFSRSHTSYKRTLTSLIVKPRGQDVLADCLSNVVLLLPYLLVKASQMPNQDSKIPKQVT